MMCSTLIADCYNVLTGLVQLLNQVSQTLTTALWASHWISYIVANYNSRLQSRFVYTVFMHSCYPADWVLDWRSQLIGKIIFYTLGTFLTLSTCCVTCTKTDEATSGEGHTSSGKVMLLSNLVSVNRPGRLLHLNRFTTGKSLLKHATRWQWQNSISLMKAFIIK